MELRQIQPSSVKGVVEGPGHISDLDRDGWHELIAYQALSLFFQLLSYHCQSCRRLNLLFVRFVCFNEEVINLCTRSANISAPLSLFLYFRCNPLRQSSIPVRFWSRSIVVHFVLLFSLCCLFVLPLKG